MYPYTAKNLFTCRAPKLHLLLNLEEKLFITLKLKRKKKQNTHTHQTTVQNTLNWGFDNEKKHNSF